MRNQKKYSLLIEPNCFGPGLRIEHLNGIFVNGKAKIGKNCNIHQFVTIGNNGKTDLAAQIGDECYIGAGAIIIGNVKIGNGATIGAGAVVVKDVPDHVTVVGVPAKVVSANKQSF